MALKKSELYSSIWQSCDELRGGMDASQYKDYVLVLLFMKYVSDKYAGQKDALLEVPSGGSFSDLVQAKGAKDIGERVNKVLSTLAEANELLKGVINTDAVDFDNDEKLGKDQEKVDRLTKLISIFQDLNFSTNRAEGDDLLGDAYEYLMRHFATESGKSKGQFYTPAEVSRMMAKVVGVGSAKSRTQTIHDPTCGSGSLLLKAHDEAKSATGFDLALYGQEMDGSTVALAKMNMYLHDCLSAIVEKDNVLSAPHFKQDEKKLKTFDFIVANPPFSYKSWKTGFNPANDLYGRFSFGIPPAKQGDMAFLLHILTCLKSTGKAAVNLPHGVLFRGNAEADIRKEIVRRGYIKGIIGLPPNLFYGTGIPACIVVLDKENAGARKGIFMIDASKGFIKDGNKNRLRAQDIHKIVDAFTRQIEIPRYSRMVPLAEISDPKNDYNLNLPRYIDSTEPEDLQDIDGHLRGGIPNGDIDDPESKLATYLKVLPSLRTALFKPFTRSGYCQLKIPLAEVKPTIFGHAEFAAFHESVTKLFADWKQTAVPHLKGFTKDGQPKALIETIAEDLLATFKFAPLLDAYDVYQHLMVLWEETMQDDCYIVSAEGWKPGARVREIFKVKKRGNDNTEKLVWPEAHDYLKGKRRFKCDLVPASVLTKRYFVAEQNVIDEAEAQVARIDQEIEEQKDELSGEGGLLEEAFEKDDDNLKYSAKDLNERLKEIGDDLEFADERKALEDHAALRDKLSAAKSDLRKAREALDAKLEVKYPKLTEDEIKTLVVDDKWLGTLAAAVQGELDRVSQTLTARICQLAERYATPLPRLIDDVAKAAAAVDGHLTKMGAVWK